MSTTTGDHVLPRNLVVESMRDNLPKVPCCTECNQRKSRIEHYVCSVLPFGGQHEAAKLSLEAVRARLKKNQRLARELATGFGENSAEHLAGLAGVPIETDKIQTFLNDLIRGLAFHHWAERLTNEEQYFSSLIHPEMDEQLFTWLAALSGSEISGDFANGHLRYSAKNISRRTALFDVAD